MESGSCEIGGCTNRRVCDKGGGHANMEWYVRIGGAIECT